jgi:hypothetical protein
MTHRPVLPSNDNQPPAGRPNVNEIPEDLPLLEPEIALVEAHFTPMIEELRRAAANDNRGRPDKETKP